MARFRRTHLQLFASNFLDPWRRSPSREFQLQLPELDLELPRMLLLCFKRLEDLIAAAFNDAMKKAEAEAAGGQSVWHAHLHLIPRYTGDTENPLGGVRNVIPYKRKPGP